MKTSDFEHLVVLRVLTMECEACDNHGYDHVLEGRRNAEHLVFAQIKLRCPKCGYGYRCEIPFYRELVDQDVDTIA
jgi:hypothetical protein